MPHAEKRLDDGDPRHGTVNGYKNWKCRCDACRLASAAEHREYMRRLREAGRVLGEHGSAIAYETGCRCDTCRLAHNQRSVEKKRRIRERRRKD